MSRNYDNWERLVAAVLKKQQLWQLFHEQSRSPSISSESSGVSFSFGLSSSFDDVPFSSPEWSASDQKEDDIGSGKTAIGPGSPSSILVKDQSPVVNVSPNKNVNSAPRRKRALKIQVSNLQVQDHDAFNRAPYSREYNISPRPTSPTPISRVHSTPLHPRAGGGHSESQTNWPDDANQQSYPLPLPPGAISNSSLSSRPNSAATSPSVPSRRLEKSENLTSPRMRWKKGKLLGRGTFGDVYVGFNSETGEMCAMKEVTIFPDDAKSKQSAMQLGKEIALLSSSRHSNLVQYYGSETVGNNLYVYFEYLSGGSIYNILQQYGKLGESAIRIYTEQILSGLAYLHSKSIAHRDVKGANILVDPNGRVKLANFGIAKHSAGQSLPSLPMDSPYWMAPEVIMNSNVCNLAMDIWSLGCTILEMATSKPPLSQYEGVVAMFKVGYGRELPTIPDYLSDEGKDFLRRCLQWNPLHRTTASQLLEHPFVKSLWPLEKPILVSTSSGHPAVSNAIKTVGIDHARSLQQLDSERHGIYSSTASKSKFHSSDIYTPRNISSHVSPVGSPLPHPRSPQQLNGRMALPLISSPQSTPGSPTPLTGGIGAIPYHHLNQSMLSQDAFPNLPKHQANNNSLSYWDPNILRVVQSGSRASQELASCDNDALRKQFGRAADRQLYGPSLLADRMSQHLLRDTVKLNPSLDLNPSPRVPRHCMARV